MSVFKRWNGEAWETIGPGIKNTASVIPNDSEAPGAYVGDALSNLKNNLDVLNEGGLILEEDFIGSQVDEWLDQHPEATTTVEDGSITIDKLNSDLKLVLKKGYVTPQEFGAVGNGTTDDTEAFRLALAEAYRSNKNVALISDYYLSSTIDVPSNVAIYGFSNLEYVNTIIVSNNIQTVFNCRLGNYMHNFAIRPVTQSYQNIIGFKCTGNDSLNLDANFIGIQISYMEKGIWVTGRNINIYDSLFSHCRYGIHIDVPTLNNQNYRGMWISRCRFHGIGEEIDPATNQEMVFTDNTAGILLDADGVSGNTSEQICDVIITDNVSDQGATLVKGYAQHCHITGNFVKTFEHPAIMITDGEREKVQTQFSSWLISGNTFIGNITSDAYGITHTAPDYLIKISSYNYVNITNNKMTRCKVAGIYLNLARQINIVGNMFSGIDTTPFLSINNQSKCSLIGNFNRSGTQPAIISDGNQTNQIIRYSGNYNFGFQSNVKINTLQYNFLTQFNTGSTDVKEYLHDYQSYMIKRTDTTTSFILFKYNTYCNSTVHFSPASNRIEWLGYDDTTGIITLYTYNFDTQTRSTLALSADLYSIEY